MFEENAWEHVLHLLTSQVSYFASKRVGSLHIVQFVLFCCMIFCQFKVGSKRWFRRYKSNDLYGLFAWWNVIRNTRIKDHISGIFWKLLVCFKQATNYDHELNLVFKTICKVQKLYLLPNTTSIVQVFRIPGKCIVKVNVGRREKTWSVIDYKIIVITSINLQLLRVWY